MERGQISLLCLSFILISSLICIGTGLTQPVNPSSIDGWFNSQYYLFKTSFNPQGVHSPIAAPAIFYWTNNKLLKRLGWYNRFTELYSATILQNLFFLSASISFYLIGRKIGLGAHHFFVSVLFTVLVESTLITQCFYSEALLHADMGPIPSYIFG